MKIILKDYETVCRHGVNPEEKTHPQRFLFTVEVEVDAPREDDIKDTVSYSEIKKAVKAFAEDNCFDLIETLADGAAKLVLDEFPFAKAVVVTVKKPDAPMSGKFAYAACVAERKWTRAYLSLGSNLGDRNATIDFAVEELSRTRGVRGVRESERIETAPYGGVATMPFINSAAEIFTYLTPFELLDRLHEIEAQKKRVRVKRWDDRTLDIDILLYGDEIVDSGGLFVPHVDMINREFVLAPLAELNPYAMHPILKRTAAELLEALRSRRS